MCLFDGCKFVGNVHVFTAAKAVEEEDEPWVFINKVSILPSSTKVSRQRAYEIVDPNLSAQLLIVSSIFSPGSESVPGAVQQYGVQAISRNLMFAIVKPLLVRSPAQHLFLEM